MSSPKLRYRGLWNFVQGIVDIDISNDDPRLTFDLSIKRANLLCYAYVFMCKISEKFSRTNKGWCIMWHKYYISIKHGNIGRLMDGLLSLSFFQGCMNSHLQTISLLKLLGWFQLNSPWSINGWRKEILFKVLVDQDGWQANGY